MNANGDYGLKSNADAELKAYTQHGLHVTGVDNKGFDDLEKANDTTLTDLEDKQQVRFNFFACWYIVHVHAEFFQSIALKSLSGVPSECQTF